MANSYDEVAYPSAVYAHTHPDGLAVLATLSGMEPAPVERCRVLELGCGNGFNLISMAYALPGSEFLGLDLAPVPIAHGTATIEKLRLKNVTLQARDVATVGAELGEFDYIIAHGLYSWTPAPVREKIMELCGRHLSAHGVAYISYNAYPGNCVRDITRGIMRYHAAHFSDPRQQLRQARGVLNLLAEAGDPADLFQQILIQENERIAPLEDGFLFHDDLNPYNQPFYFHEFMDAARPHGLQFLAEAGLVEKQEREYSPRVQAALDQLDPDDIVSAEHYRDFLRGRAFRRTLLCREGLPLNRALDSAHLSQLFLRGEIRPAGAACADHATEVFRGPNDSEFDSAQPIVKAALHRIGAAWPDYIHFPDLLAHVRRDVEAAECVQSESDAADLAEAMLQLAIAGGLEVHAHRPPFVLEPGTHPIASALARAQIENGTRVATLLHRVVEIDGAPARFLLQQLDGTRDRTALREALRDAVHRGQFPNSTLTTESITDAEIDRLLRWLARLGLLIRPRQSRGDS